VPWRRRRASHSQGQTVGPKRKSIAPSA
jgi:hypothetical protein